MSLATFSRRGALIFGLMLAAPALAQPSNVSIVKKYAWSENCGWLNFRNAGQPAGLQGVHVGTTFLAGFVWGENIGWINLGDGTPAGPGGAAYANVDGADSGVNRTPTDDLAGFAWGENVGWINFGPLAGIGPGQQARYDAAGRRLRGYAWGENVGWINLDDASAYVGTCPADFNADGVLSPSDLFAYLTAYFAGSLSADTDGSSTLAPTDIFGFLNLYFAGCG